MKTLQVVAPGDARVVDAAALRALPDEVVLQVRLVGMCGSDLNTFRGKNPLVAYPRVLGHEIAATIVDLASSGCTLPVGSNVVVSPYTSCGRCSSCLKGRRNACQFNETFGVQRDGAMAEFISVPPEKLYEAPELSLKELALVEPLTIGNHAVGRASVAAGETVAILGCGGVGLGAVAAAARRGATVIGIDIDDGKLALAQEAGAAHAIHSKRDNVHEALLAVTDGLGPDVVIEAIGLPETFCMAIEEVAYAGRVIYLGWAKEPVTYETRLFILKELDIRGSRNALPEDFRSVIAMLTSRAFPVEKAISKIVPLDDGPATLASWSENPANFSKIMVEVTP